MYSFSGLIKDKIKKNAQTHIIRIEKVILHPRIIKEKNTKEPNVTLL